MRYAWVSLLLVLSNVAYAKEQSIFKLPHVPGAANTSHVIGMFLLVCALVFALVLILNYIKRNRGFRGTNLKVIGGVNLNSKEKLLVVEHRNTELLLGISPGGIRTLHSCPVSQSEKHASATETTPASRSFIEHLKANLNNRSVK